MGEKETGIAKELTHKEKARRLSWIMLSVVAALAVLFGYWWYGVALLLFSNMLYTNLVVNRVYHDLATRIETRRRR